MKGQRLLVGAALAVALTVTAALALDRIFPPDLTRYHERSTEVVDANGRLLRAFTTADGRWRLKTTIDDVDPAYIALLKTYEDYRFDWHPGVDPMAVVRATGLLIARGHVVSGASTLTMQAARLLEPRKRTFRNKVIEAARALQLEWRFSKREVMAIYLTLTPMGGNLEGVRAASLAYFGKEPRHLSAAEAALLVAIPQAPSKRRPDRFPAAAQTGRDGVLARGLEDGVIDRALYDKALSRPVPTQRLALPMNAPHLSAWLAGQSPNTAVPTTIRLQLQQSLEQLVGEERGQLTDKAQIAMVVMDNRTGGVVAWLAGGDFFGRAGQVDLVRSHRSPGSALKPMIYALAFDDRTLHPESIVDDVPVRFKDWLPRNFDRDHQGAVTVRRALQQSLNVPAVLALERIGPARFLSALRSGGATPILPPGDPGNSLGMALGSATISPLEMAGLYSGLANGGRFAAPQVRRDQPRPEPVQIVGDAASWYVADVLSDAPLPDGFASLPVALRERRVAYKTGTSAGFRDAWAAGYSANWTVVVWVGHADGTPRPGQLGRMAALPILFKAFGRLPGEDNRAPRPPADVMRVGSWKELPLRMQRLAPTALEGAPRIAYPPPDARLELGARDSVTLAASGTGRLHWLVNGRPITGNSWTPDGAGEMRLAVVDDTGRSTAVLVHIVRRQ